MRTTRDASDRLLLLLTRTTSTFASWAPDSSQGFRPILVRGTRCFTTPRFASAGPSTFSAPGAFSSPRRIDATEPLTSLSLPRNSGGAFARASFVEEAKTEPPTAPVKGLRRFRSEMPSIGECAASSFRAPFPTPDFEAGFPWSRGFATASHLSTRFRARALARTAFAVLTVPSRARLRPRNRSFGLGGIRVALV